MDARTDVFSLGVMLYEMIADYAPFVGATLREVIAAILRDEPPSLAACALEMPLEFERIVRQSLCKDHAARYQTAQELFVDLQQLKKRLEFKAEVRRESRVQQGMFSEAVAQWQRAMTFAGGHELGTILSSAYAEADFTAAHAVRRKRVERMSERVGRGEYVPAIYFARESIKLDDMEKALQWLRQACEERNVYALLMNSDPFYDKLRFDPRFQSLLRRVGVTL